MMSKISRFGVIMIVLLPFYFLAMIRISHSAPSLGLNQGKLKPCPDSPNCVCSENNPADALQLRNYDSEQAWHRLQNIITDQGGHIIENTDSYLRAEFHSKWLGFIDDLEARLDKQQDVIHLRSASRTGYYDFGVNRNRIDTIKEKMNLSIRTTANEQRE